MTTVLIMTSFTITASAESKSLLTGEAISDERAELRPCSFMIDNVKDALPQSGIEFASVYVESEVEGNLSRICAVFEDYDMIEKIGPLRSCRDNFISMTAGFDTIYEHYGQAAYALPYLESDDVDNVSAMMGYADFFRDGPHSAPHNAYVSGESMKSMIETIGYRKEHETSYRSPFQFSADGLEIMNDGGRDAGYAAAGYPYNAPYFVYDEETGLYNRYQYEEPQIGENCEEPLAVKNLIFEYQDAALYQESPYWHYQTTGSGKGKYLTNGKAVDITWERPDFFGAPVYHLEDGSELLMNPGKTWVTVIRKSEINNCLIGSSVEDATCIVSQNEAQEMISEASEYIREYKAGENDYLQNMAEIRKINVEKHGGRTKVEPNLP